MRREARREGSSPAVRGAPFHGTRTFTGVAADDRVLFQIIAAEDLVTEQMVSDLEEWLDAADSAVHLSVEAGGGKRTSAGVAASGIGAVPATVTKQTDADGRQRTRRSRKSLRHKANR